MPRVALTDEQRGLAEQWIAGAYKAARPWANRYPGLAEEIETATLMGLVKAAAEFDPSRGFAFSTFLFECVRNACRTAITKSNAVRHKPPGHQLPSLDPAYVPSDPDPFDGELLGRLFRSLPPRDAEIVFRYVIDGETLQVIADRVGLTKQAVSLIVIRSLDRLRKHPIIRAIAS